MPGLRALGTSFIAGGIALAVGTLYMRWPTFLAVAMAALFLVATLMLAGSFADDGSAADAAWRAAAEDLLPGETAADPGSGSIDRPDGQPGDAS